MSFLTGYRIWFFVFCLLLLSFSVSADTEVDSSEFSCLNSNISFVTSALEKIVYSPEYVLNNEEKFWSEEKAQEYTKIWAKNINYEIPMKAWRKKLQSMVDKSGEDSILIQLAESIISQKEVFLMQSIPHLCSFLPEHIDIDIPVYFTAFIPARSFVTGGIIINVSAGYWKGNPDNILNNLVHELFHVGFSHMRPERKEKPHENEMLYNMLETLQNEGLATYIAYEARDIFPAPDEVDYDLLENPDDVAELFDDVNMLYEMVGIESDEDVQKKSWKIGVNKRAYYITGAYMAQMIDRELGRDVLNQTIVDGPISFINTFNSIQSIENKIKFPDYQTIIERKKNSQHDSKIRKSAMYGLGILLVLGLGWVVFRRKIPRV